MTRIWRNRPQPWVAAYVCSEEEMDALLAPEHRTPGDRTTYVEVESWGSQGEPLVYSTEKQRLVRADSLPDFVGLRRGKEREGRDWEITERETMPGMCGVCVVRVLSAESVVYGLDENEHTVDRAFLLGALHEWVSGEYSLRHIHLRTGDGEKLRMSAVTTIAGTALCAVHAGQTELT